jgi:hypothetical protein
MYPSQSNNPYEFIMNPQQPQKKRLPLPGLGGGNSFMKLILLVVGGGLGLIILMTVITTVFFGGKVNIEDLVGLTQTQTELSRVALQVTPESDQAIKNAAANTRLAADSHKQTWLTFLGEHGRIVGDKEFQLKANTQTDTKLATAKQTGSFDTVFTEAMRSQLTAYASAIKAAYDAAGDAGERKTLSDHYAEVQLLLKQWPEG